MLQRILAFILACSISAYAQGNSFDKVRYNGGTIATKVDAKDWNNRLTITSDLITFQLKDGQKVPRSLPIRYIPPKTTFDEIIAASPQSLLRCL